MHDLDFDETDGDGDEDFWEEAVQECGQLPPHLGGGCQLDGTEYCDFECPLRELRTPVNLTDAEGPNG